MTKMKTSLMSKKEIKIKNTKKKLKGKKIKRQRNHRNLKSKRRSARRSQQLKMNPQKKKRLSLGLIIVLRNRRF